MRKELLKGLTEEQIKLVNQCDNIDDLLQLAKDEGVELNDEQLEAVSGGCGTEEPIPNLKCPQCGSPDVDSRPWSGSLDGSSVICYCNKCGHQFLINRYTYKG